MKRAGILLFCLLCWGSYAARAQLCLGGSSGDAVFYNNLDKGFPGKNNFNYTDSVPGQGFISLKTSSVGLNPNWVALPASSGGRMLLVNAAPTARMLYTDTIKTLCASTQYAFGGDMTDMLRAIGPAPDVTFIVETADGQVLKQFNYISKNGFSPEGQCGIIFTTPATGGNVVLTIISNAQNNTYSQVFAIGDLFLRDCGPALIPTFTKGEDAQKLIACVGSSQVLHISMQYDNLFPDPFYQWQQLTSTERIWVNIYGATGPTLDYPIYNASKGYIYFRLVTGPTIYQNSPTCIYYSRSATFQVVDYPPVATAKATSPACEGDNVTLSATGGDTYAWTGPNGFTSFSSSPVIKNVSQVNAGNYHVVATNAGTCSTPSDATLTINIKPTAIAGAPITICRGDEATLSASGGVSYQWAPADGLADANVTSPMVAPGSTTTYTVTVTNVQGCKATAQQTVTVINPPVADAGPDKATVQDKPVKLNGKITNATSFYWTPADNLNDIHSLNPVATPQQDITYTLHVIPEAGCTTEVTDDVFVAVRKKIVIPNMFSPNNDGINDTWIITALDAYPDAIVQVFNRYGGEVFGSISYPKPWDGKVNGKPIPSGTYYYKIDLKNGTVLSGWVAVLR
jgi:gliding motility-associated-like protein